MVEITIVEGNGHEDSRGRVNHFNEFDLGSVKRLYSIEHYDVTVVRAWQGHQRESENGFL